MSNTCSSYTPPNPYIRYIHTLGPLYLFNPFYISNTKKPCISLITSCEMPSLSFAPNVGLSALDKSIYLTFHLRTSGHMYITMRRQSPLAQVVWHYRWLGLLILSHLSSTAFSSLLFRSLDTSFLEVLRSFSSFFFCVQRFIKRAFSQGLQKQLGPIPHLLRKGKIGS